MNANLTKVNLATDQRQGEVFLKMLRLLSGEEQRIAYAVLEGMQLQQQLDVQRRDNQGYSPFPSR